MRTTGCGYTVVTRMQDFLGLLTFCLWTAQVISHIRHPEQRSGTTASCFRIYRTSSTEAFFSVPRTSDATRARRFGQLKIRAMSHAVATLREDVPEHGQSHPRRRHPQYPVSTGNRGTLRQARKTRVPQAAVARKTHASECLHHVASFLL